MTSVAKGSGSDGGAKGRGHLKAEEATVARKTYAGGSVVVGEAQGHARRKPDKKSASWRATMSGSNGGQGPTQEKKQGMVMEVPNISFGRAEVRTFRNPERTGSEETGRGARVSPKKKLSSQGNRSLRGGGEVNILGQDLAGGCKKCRYLDAGTCCGARARRGPVAGSQKSEIVEEFGQAM